MSFMHFHFPSMLVVWLQRSCQKCNFFFSSNFSARNNIIYTLHQHLDSISWLWLCLEASLMDKKDNPFFQCQFCICYIHIPHSFLNSAIFFLDCFFSFSFFIDSLILIFLLSILCKTALLLFALYYFLVLTSCESFIYMLKPEQLMD